MSNPSDEAIDTLINYLKQKKLTYILDKLNDINLLTKLRRRKGDYILDIFAPPANVFKEFRAEMLYVFNGETDGVEENLSYPDLQLDTNTIITWSKAVTIFDNTVSSAKNEDNLIIIPIKIYLYNGAVKTNSKTYKPDIGSSEKEEQKIATKMLISSVKNGTGFDCVKFNGYSLRKFLTSWVIYESSGGSSAATSNKEKDADIIYNLAASLVKYCFGWGKKETDDSLNYNLLLGERLSYSPYVTILSLIAPCVGLLSNTEVENWDGLFDKSASGKNIYKDVLKTLLKSSRKVDLTPNFASADELINIYISFCKNRYNNIFKNNEVTACSMLVTDMIRFCLLSKKNPNRLSDLKHFVIEIYGKNEDINKKILLNKMTKKENINDEFFADFYESDVVLATINNSNNNRYEENIEKELNGLF